MKLPQLHNPLPQDLKTTCAKAASILEHFLRGRTALDERMIPQKIVDSARGCGYIDSRIAIITIVKAGVLWSGRAGSGLVVSRLPDGKWSAPSAIMAAGTRVFIKEWALAHSLVLRSQIAYLSSIMMMPYVHSPPLI